MSTSSIIDGEPQLSAASQLRTLVELLQLRALGQPEKVIYTFLADGEQDAVTLTSSELDQRARALSAWLKPVVATGDRVLLLYPPGLEFITAFFACLYAGAVAVPAYPPRRNRSLLRLQAIAADAQAAVALTTSTILARVAPGFSQNPYLQPLRWLATDSVGETAGESVWQEPAVNGEALAFLQYTSGSTSAPKGVMLTHANLLYNAALVYHACEHTPDDSYVSWLPTFHDMGFMAGLLQPLYGGLPVVLMSPAAFLQYPVRWLQAISRYKATTSGGPNFAYDLCVRKITAEQRATLDLSSWSIAFNGAEPVRQETLERFSETFAPCGFRPEAFFPCYGLAEATLMVSGGFKSRPPRVKRVRASALKAGLVVEAPPDGADGQSLVCCGASLLEQQILIVNPDTLTRRQPNEVGEIWVAGRSVAEGYWNQPEETERTFRAYVAETGEGPFLRTGDLGAWASGELLVTGRLKDLIVIRGLNHYPQDIELTAERAHAALRPGCGAAFSVEVGDEEQLVIVQEVDHRASDLDAAMSSISRAVTEEHEVEPHAVVLIKHGTIPKTSSGKIQRHLCRAGFLERSLEVIAECRSRVVTDSEWLPAAPASTLQSREEIENWLARLFAAKLGVEVSQIELDRPISHYGLDSLLAIELKHKIEAHLGVLLPIVSFFEGPSITALAALACDQLAQLPTSPASHPSAAQGATATSAEHRLSRGQQALWFLYQLAPESTAYNIVSAVRIPGELDVAALRRAFQALVDRHPTLRTTFTSGDIGPVQQIHEYVEVHFREADATAWSETMLDEVLIGEAHSPFNLEEGPLLRLSLFARSASEHVLLLAVHHIVVDFWSLAVLMHELEILYQAEKTGAQATLAPLPLQYTDYVRWQEEMLSGPEGERLWTYWQQQLGGELPLLNLPTDRPRPRVQTYRGASHAFALGAELTGELKTFSRDRGATLYMTLLAALQVLLYRYTHQEDILVGSPTAGRNWAAVSDMVGYFVNPVALRADFSAGPKFEEFLGEVRRTVLASFEHQDFPFALLVERLQPVRDPSHSPLFNVMFVLQKAHLLDKEGMASFALGEADARIELGELTFESLDLEQRVAQVDLTLMMAEGKGGLACSLQYNTDLFDAATIERMSGHFQTLLEAIVATPEKAVAELDMLNAAEREQLLTEWNQTAREYPRERCVHELFEEQAERTPEAVAVVYQEEQLTYGELNRRANQLAHYLRKQGVGPEVLVGICVERSVEMVVGLLGILKAGGAYVPLDPEYPRERLSFMLEDAQVSLLLTQRRLADRIAECRPDVFYLDSQWDTIQREREENPAGKVTPANLAYIIYTSGSTGQPKGVLATHQAVCNRLLWGQDVYPLTPEDRVLQGAAFGFDFSVWEFFAPLLAGSALIIGSSEEMQDSEHLVELIVVQQVTVAHFVPAHLEVLLEQPGLQASCLRLVFSGGEALSGALQQRFSALLSSVLFNQYGPTEATIDATYYACLNGPEHPAIPIGRPIANTQIYLLDEQLQPVPVGVASELYIGGAGLARGYLKRPDLTAERFLPHPFSTEPGARLYRTGDLAKYLPDGNIEFLGRIDQQVKLRGYRIELGEIETVLGQHPQVEQAVVLLWGEGTEQRLVAYLVAEGELRQGDLRSHLKELLPDYMIPSAFVQLEEIPLTPNGKIDRRALPAPEQGRLEAGQQYVAAQTPIEEMLVGIWEEVLGVKRVGVHDNFFELGGHSLLATQLVSRVRAAFGVEMPLRQLFESPTVQGLAAVVEMGLRNGEGVLLPPLQAMPRVGELPLSFGQQRLWIIDQLEANSAVYNMPAAVHLTGELNFRALEQTFGEILRRHEILRTTFATSEGSPLQVISDASDVGLPLIDLTHLAADERETEARRLATAEAQLPFDLSRGPLFRVQVLRLSATEHILLCTMHHIVSDGWSMGVLIREVATLYEAYSQGQPSPLPELSIQYADYALWQREWLTGEVLETQLSYWREQLQGAPAVLELPTDRPRPAVQSFRGAAQPIQLSEELTEKLRQLSRAEGVTLFMTLLSAFSVLLSRLSGQDDIVVGTPIANRTRVETEGLIGFFVNTLVLRTKVEAGESFRALLAKVREVTLGAYGHQDVPFEKLVEELQPERDLSHSPLFQVMFVLQNAPRETLRLGGVELRAAGASNETAKFDLTLELTESGEGLAGTIEYSTELFEAETIERWGGHFLTLLEAVVREPERRIAELEMLSHAERERLLVEWNQTAREYPRESCVHELFEQQVERTPEAVAVVYEEERVTYGELNRRANQLAHYLRKQGVGPEVLVGLCVERSIEMVVGLLGILKAGGAYVPLDPEYPPERLGFMLEDAEIKILLTQEHLGAVLHSQAVEVVKLDSEWEAMTRERVVNPASGVVGQNLAYMIYTSGSTGKPKGVMVCHTNVVNFFAGMDSRVGDEQPGTWLAVTSISFDISALELFWTLARGYKVVIQGGAQRDFKADDASRRGMDFSLFYFASEEQQSGQDLYRLLLEGARFADRHGFSAVWTPERHFHQFGGVYPNPSVTSAALAVVTEGIQIRAGSVVLPLHDPVRVAEEWAVVDNLSGGRVAISFASGWHADDFVFAPDNYADRHEVMFQQIETVRRLWRGESITRKGGGKKEVELKIHPRPVQPELQVWVTAAGSSATFQRAGEVGANLLTHLLGQSLEELKEKIELYRAAWRKHGRGPGDGHVTLMLHTLIGKDLDEVRQTVRGPFTAYLRSAIGLLQNSARSLGRDLNAQDFTEADLEAVLDHAFERYFETSGLMGTPTSCLRMVNQLKAVGVDELACLIDFGVDDEAVLASLTYLDALKQNSKNGKAGADYSIAAQISRQQVTHMQCTPSMARMLSIGPESLGALKSLRKLLLGGEALPVSLAAQLKTELPCELHNMYGPTETTIWSTTHLIEQVGSSVPLGRPIANTDIFILDQQLQPVPIGVPGELYIGGDGVVRGYLKRPELTAERFIPDPHGRRPGARLYQTGDRARYLPDGNIEFLGRGDQQIKLHGHRIELGEVEAALNAHAGVRAAVVTLSAQGTEQRLVTYLVKQEHEETLSAVELRSYLRERLPEYMIPSAFVQLAELPLTPNGKIDRRALPAPEEGRLEAGKEYVAPQTPVEERLVKLWEEVLGVERVGVHDNFFELGGHSLLATQLASRLRVAFEMELPLRIIFESPTVARLASAIEQRQSEAVNEEEKYRILAQIDQLSEEEVRLLLAGGDDRA